MAQAIAEDLKLPELKDVLANDEEDIHRILAHISIHASSSQARESYPIESKDIAKAGLERDAFLVLYLPELSHRETVSLAATLGYGNVLLSRSRMQRALAELREMEGDLAALNINVAAATQNDLPIIKMRQELLELSIKEARQKIENAQSQYSEKSMEAGRHNAAKISDVMIESLGSVSSIFRGEKLQQAVREAISNPGEDASFSANVPSYPVSDGSETGHFEIRFGIMLSSSVPATITRDGVLSVSSGTIELENGITLAGNAVTPLDDDKQIKVAANVSAIKGQPYLSISLGRPWNYLTVESTPKDERVKIQVENTDWGDTIASGYLRDGTFEIKATNGNQVQTRKIRVSGKKRYSEKFSF